MCFALGGLPRAGSYIVDIIRIVIGNISTMWKPARGKPPSAKHINVINQQKAKCYPHLCIFPITIWIISIM